MVPARRVLIVRRTMSSPFRRMAAPAHPTAPIAPSSTATQYLHLAAAEGRRSRRQNYAIHYQIISHFIYVCLNLFCMQIIVPCPPPCV